MKKIATCTIIVVVLFALSAHGGDLIGLAITAGIVYFIAQLFIPSDGQQHVEESQDDYHARLQQEDDDAYYRQEEENRINQENIANQEALDRLS